MLKSFIFLISKVKCNGIKNYDTFNLLIAVRCYINVKKKNPNFGYFAKLLLILFICVLQLHFNLRFLKFCVTQSSLHPFVIGVNLDSYWFSDESGKLELQNYGHKYGVVTTWIHCFSIVALLLPFVKAIYGVRWVCCVYSVAYVWIVNLFSVIIFNLRFIFMIWCCLCFLDCVGLLACLVPVNLR